MQQTLRTIHHLSCSGGTLISKCIVAMDKVALASEVHPYNTEPYRYNPFDPLQLLFAGGMIRPDKDRLDAIFKQRIALAEQFSQEDGKSLVIRDHSHFDFLMKPEPDVKTKSVLNLLTPEYEIKSVVTVRNPIDSYLSMNKNNWNHGELDFDGYCKRVLVFLDAYSNFPVYRYEDFCERPKQVMQKICKVLGISYTDAFLERFHQITLTGDSGRGKAMTTISPLPSTSYSETFQQEVARSSHYFALCNKLRY